MTEISRISDLKPGDQVFWKRRTTGFIKYNHHAIVVGVDVNQNKLQLIEYSGNSSSSAQVDEYMASAQFTSVSGSSGSMGIIKRSTYKFNPENEKTYREDHAGEAVFNDKLVVWRAETRLDEKKYHLIYNNCESFANWCKTGRNCSKQSGECSEVQEPTTSSAYAGAYV